MVYMSDEEIKHTEFMILRNNICKSRIDINKIIEDEYNNKNILINKEKDKANGYIKKKDSSKKEPSKRVPDDKYNYNL